MLSVIEKVFRLDTFQEKGKTEAKLSSEGRKARKQAGAFYFRERITYGRKKCDQRRTSKKSRMYRGKEQGKYIVPRKRRRRKRRNGRYGRSRKMQ